MVPVLSPTQFSIGYFCRFFWLGVLGAFPPVDLMGQPTNMRFEKLSIKHGLSQNSVNATYQDQKGFLWFGSQSGLNRFDGYKFVVYQNDPEDEYSLSGGYIKALFQDSKGRFWVGTRAGGLNYFDEKSEKFYQHRHSDQNPSSLSSDEVNDIYEDDQGRLWVATSGGLDLLDEENNRWRHFRFRRNEDHGLDPNNVTALLGSGDGRFWVGTDGCGLHRFDPSKGESRCLNRILDDQGNPIFPSIRDLVMDTQGLVWIGTFGGGLYSFDPKNEKLTRFRHQQGDPHSLSDDEVCDLQLDSQGGLWIGTQAGGLNFWDPATGSFQHYRFQSGNPDSLSSDRVYSVFEDQSGILWIGTGAGGLNKLNIKSAGFVHYQHESGNPNSLSHQGIWSIYQDRRGLLWIGTFDGLNRLDRKNNRFTWFKPEPSNPKSLSQQEVRSICEDARGELWIATSGGLNRFDRETETFQRFLHRPGDPESLADNQTRHLLCDRDGIIWIATNHQGLERFDPETLRFQHFRHDPENPHSLSDNRLFFCFEDRGGLLWIGTRDGGLNRFDRESGKFQAFRHDPKNPKSISQNTVLAINELPSTAGRELWVGTPKGLNRLDLQKNTFRTYRHKDGLIDEVIYSIVPDKYQHLWMSTNKGLIEFNPVEETFENYGLEDGLQSDEFNFGAFFSDDQGELFFGGINGFNAFFPENVKRTDSIPPKIVITDFLLFNQSMALRHKRADSPLKSSIFTSDRLVLDHRDFMFSFEFAALHFAGPDKNQYAFKLEGGSGEYSDWIFTGADHRFAVYTNLSSGDYTFKVKGSNKDGVWNEAGASIAISILPPPWRTWWAYSCYSLLLGSLAYAYFRIQSKKLAKERIMAEKERIMVGKLKQIDRLKDEFLASTSHELRTPLNGIIGLAESLRDGVAGKMPDKAVNDLTMIVSSGKRLANLVNDILDFSKLRNDSLQLRKKPLDLFPLVELVLTFSSHLMGDKSLLLINDIPKNFPPVLADENRLQQILHNLVGNAVKFTPKGFVRVEGKLNGNIMEISVTDSGIGIPGEKLDAIFEYFQQGSPSIGLKYGGTGLGLAVTKKLVEMHEGTIEVTSVEGQGSQFTFSLPRTAGKSVRFKPIKPIRVAAAPIEIEADTEYAPPPLSANENGFDILIVDDERINRKVLSNYLSLDHYRITEVPDGIQALKIICRHKESHLPNFDLILLDVMMPHLSGFEVCRRLRQFFGAHELPIIFLTAKNQGTDLVAGFKAGANDYLIKPIDKGELLSRVKTHLRLLDFNRNLENKVNERTRELKTKNKVLDARFQELETLDKIVRTINSEMNFRRLFQTLLEQGLRLFHQAEKGTFLEYDREKKSYKFVATIGHDLEDLKKITFTKQDLYTTFGEKMKLLDEGIFQIDDFADYANLAGLAGIDLPHSLIAIAIPADEQVAGILIFENLAQEEILQHNGMKRLSRFREHAVSAMSKAKAVQDLIETQKELVEAAQAAGKAEIAGNVLHHLGNALNHLNTSAQLIHETLHAPKWQQLLGKISDLFLEHDEDLISFLSEENRGKTLSRTIEGIFKKASEQNRRLNQESLRLIAKVQGMVTLLQEQQEYTQPDQKPFDLVSLNDLIEETLQTKNYLLKSKNIKLVKELSPLPIMALPKDKFKRVLFFLLKNAWEAIDENQREEGGTIRIATRQNSGQAVVEISDTGIGIPENRQRELFVHGYTTKQNSRGFGLHYCANAVMEMSGTIVVLSPGTQEGTSVVLSFPLENH